MISAEKEAERMKHAIRAVRDACSLPISVDTPRATVAAVALSLGAEMINDVTGLKHDPMMARVAADNDAVVILCAYEKRAVSGNAVQVTINVLRDSIGIALDAGVKPGMLIVDPAIGFFRQRGGNPFFTRLRGTTWLERDLTILRKLASLRRLRKPICVSVSRKSFIGRILGIEKPAERLLGSIAAEAVCVLNGADIIRTHNVMETGQAVRIAEAVRGRR
jgi:dihydropteroate synthase